jgi:hypothetical protein
MSSPPYIVAAASMIAVSHSSDKRRERCFHIVGPLAIGAISFFLLALSFPKSYETPIRYACTFTALLSQAAIPVALSWLSNNIFGQTKGATAMGLMISFGNLSGIIAPQIYSSINSESFFRRGHVIMGGSLVWAIVWALVIRMLWRKENSKIFIIEGDKYII